MLLGAWGLALAACTGGGAAPVGDAAAGQLAFSVCASCHQVGPGARSGFGPPLNGLIGRRAGTAVGYNYSAAMQNATIVWSEPSLAAFIKDPDRVVPGTKMRFSSLGYSDQKIADLLAYLRSFSPPDHVKPD